MNHEPPAFKAHRLRSLVLLVSLVALVATSFWTPGSRMVGLMLMVFYVSVFCMAGYLIGARRHWLTAYFATALPFAILRTTEGLEYKHPALTPGAEILSLILCTMFILLVFRFSLLEPGTLRIDRVIAGICGYLILAFLGESLFSLHEILRPGGFIDGSGQPFDGSAGGFLYFSLVTLSTTGYGDILPVLPGSRMLASMEAVIGTLFLAVFISTLISRDGRKVPRSEDAS